MGETIPLIGVEFNKSIKIEARPEKLTSEVGALLEREVIERLNITQWLSARLSDPRDPKRITHPLEELLNAEFLLLCQGWRDQDDADTLRDDPMMRLSASTRHGLSPLETRCAEERDRDHNPEVPDGLPSQPTLSRLERALSSEENRAVLRDGLLMIAAKRYRAMRGGKRQRYLTIDIDSLPVDVHGNQPGSAYNGYYHRRVFHPLVANVAETGDLLDMQLREGNVHTANGGLGFILPLLDKVEREMCQVASVRIDAGFPEDELLAALEKRRTAYVARIKNNAVLDRMAIPYLKRPVGRPSSAQRTWFHELNYEAESWRCPRRVVLVVQERPGELLPHHFWLLTSWSAEQMSAEQLLQLYRRRGTAEGHYGELMNVLNPALSSSPRQKSHYRGRPVAPHTHAGDSFAQNEVRLLMHAIAYNILHVVRRLTEAATGEGWSLQRLRERVLRLPARIVIHARRAVVVIGLNGAALWQAIWHKLARFRQWPT